MTPPKPRRKHMADHSTARKQSDFLPALTGLVVGACVLFVIVFTIVTLTNHKYAGHSEAVEATQ